MRKLFFFLLFLISINSIAQTAATYKAKAEVFFEKGNYKEAINELTLALKVNPKDEKALRNRAMSYDRLEKFDLALKDNLELFKIDKSARTLGNIGYDYLWLEKYEDSRKYLNLAIDLSPTDVIYRFNKALTYQYEDNLEKAIIMYDEALKVAGNHKPSLISKTRCLLKLNLFDKASVIVDSFFLQKRFDVEMLLFRGDIKKHFGKTEEALSDYSRAIAILPEDLTLIVRAAKCLNELGLYEEEIDLRKRDLDLQFKNGESNESKALSFATLAIAQEAAGYYENALLNYDESIKLETTGGDGRIYFIRCILKAKMKDYEGACKDLTKTKELNPTDAGEYDQYFEEDEEFEDFVKYCMPNP